MDSAATSSPNPPQSQQIIIQLPPRSLLQRIVDIAFPVINIIAAVFFGAWAIEAYKVSRDALKAAQYPNKIALWMICNDLVRIPSCGSLQN